MSATPKRVRKAVLPVAGLGTRFLPATKAMPKEMLTVVDKPLIQYAVEECIASGIEARDFRHRAAQDRHRRSFRFRAGAGTVSRRTREKERAELVHGIGGGLRISYTRQSEALGLGHAVLCAADLVGDEPFAVLLGDVIMDGGIPATKQLIEIYEATGKGAIHVEEVPREKRSHLRHRRRECQRRKAKWRRTIVEESEIWSKSRAPKKRLRTGA